jgi:hypothetical protein
MSPGSASQMRRRSSWPVFEALPVVPPGLVARVRPGSSQARSVEIPHGLPEPAHVATERSRRAPDLLARSARYRVPDCRFDLGQTGSSGPRVVLSDSARSIPRR